MKNRNKIMIIISIGFVLLLLTQYVFAAGNYFLIEIPKGYYVYDEGLTGDTKLVVVREDSKINFNIQVSESQIYYEYTEAGLNDLIDVASKDMSNYDAGTIEGKISTIADYPCYELNYKVKFKETEKEMHIRQLYLYEDTYNYTITIGAESEEIFKEDEVQTTLKSFTIEHYKRDNVLNEEEKIKQEDIENEEKKGEKKINPILITAVSVLVITFVTLLIKLIVARLKSKKNIGELKSKTKKTKKFQ